MSRHGIKLTAAFVRRIKTPGKYRDAHGLMLRVTSSGSKQWTQRIEFQGRRREFGLGGYPVVSLAEARETALDNRRLVRAGGDPSAARRPTVPTFEDAAAKVIEVHRPNWKNSKHAAQWQTTLRQYAFPRLGRRRVDLVNTSDVMAVLLPIWNEKHETARRVRQRIGAVMQWAMAQGYRQDNPAGEAIHPVVDLVPFPRPGRNGTPTAATRSRPPDPATPASTADCGCCSNRLRRM